MLEHVKHTGPVMSAAGPNLKSTALFRAVGPGTAYVVAKVQRVDPSVLDGLTDDPVRRAELARELKLASTATLRVNVGGDREPLHVEATTTSGAPTPIRVFGLEPGTCIQRELSDAPGLVLTLLDGEGEIANGVYSPPPLSPDALWVHTPDNPVAFCESVNLEAGVDFGHGIGDVHVKAELPDGRVGVGAIGRWAPDVSNEIEWLEPTTAVLSSPNSRELLLAIIDPLELDDLPLHVSYTHEGTTLEAEALLRILPVQRRMLLSPHPSVRATHRPSFQVGPGAWVDPSAWLEVEGEPGRCDPPPIRDLTQKIKWTLRPPGEAPHPLDPPEQLQVAGEYRLLARYPMSSGGDFVSWTDIEVLPSRATVRVGPVQPGLPRTGADPRR
ncbi:MAG: hypothetical protein GY946_15400 [bacterium]|nr:hypothetical protein [bacterium]